MWVGQVVITFPHVLRSLCYEGHFLNGVATATEHQGLVLYRCKQRLVKSAFEVACNPKIVIFAADGCPSVCLCAYVSNGIALHVARIDVYDVSCCHANHLHGVNTVLVAPVCLEGSLKQYYLPCL